MDNTGVWLHLFYTCRTICVRHSYIIHLYYMCRTCILSATHVKHLYVYTCNAPKTPHMYYICSTTGHVEIVNRISQTIVYRFIIYAIVVSKFHVMLLTNGYPLFVMGLSQIWWGLRDLTNIYHYNRIILAYN